MEVIEVGIEARKFVTRGLDGVVDMIKRHGNEIDPEVLEKPERRIFTAAYKVLEAAICPRQLEPKTQPRWHQRLGVKKGVQVGVVFHRAYFHGKCSKQIFLRIGVTGLGSQEEVGTIGCTELLLEGERSVQLLALAMAAEGGECQEVPIGAVVRGATGFVLAQGFNCSQSLADPSAHAEIVVLRCAGERTGSFRLSGSMLAVSLEPCPMCVAATGIARIDKVIYSALRDELLTHPRNPAPLPLHSLAYQQYSSALLRFFFEKRRQT